MSASVSAPHAFRWPSPRRQRTLWAGPSPPRRSALPIRDDLACRYAATHAAEATALLETMPPGDAAAFVADVPADVAAEIFRLATPQLAEALCTALEVDHLASVLAGVPLAFVASALRRLDDEPRRRILSALDEERRGDLESVLAYPPRTAGAFMDPRAVALPRTLTAEEALGRLRASPRDLLYNIYVIDEEKRLAGVLSLRELLSADPARRLGDLMRTKALTAPVDASAAAIVAHPGWRETHSLPVIDDDGRFVGAIRYSTLRRLQDEQAQAPKDPSAHTIQALGDLFWTGVGGLLTAAASAVTPRDTSDRPQTSAGLRAPADAPPSGIDAPARREDDRSND